MLPQLLQIFKPRFHLGELTPLGTQLQRSAINLEGMEVCFGFTAKNNYRAGVGELEGQVIGSGGCSYLNQCVRDLDSR